MALVPFQLSIFSSKHCPDSSSYATGVGSYLASRHCECGWRRALELGFHLPSPISHRPSSPSCLSFEFGFHAHHTNLSHDPSLSFSLRALKFKRQIRVQQTLHSSILICGTRTQCQRWSVDDHKRRLSLSTLWGGHEDVLITAEFYNYCSKVNHRQSIIKLLSLSLSMFTSDFNVNIQCWAINDQSAIAIRNSY